MSRFEYCGRYTHLKISGDTEQLRALRTRAVGVNYDPDNKEEVKMAFSLESLYPAPAELAASCKNGMSGTSNELIAKYGHDNLAGWCEENWGVRENNFGCKEQIVNDQNWTFFIETWLSVPSQALLKLSAEYPKLKFQYEYSFAGQISECSAGTIFNGSEELHAPNSIPAV